MTLAANRLELCPVSLFAMVMGFAGLTLSSRQVERLGLLPPGIALASSALTLLVLAAL